MNTLENNKLIAEFMGLRYGRGSVRTYVIENNIEVLTKDLKYHVSWGWLMPVVEKIEDIALEDVEGSHKVHRFLVRIEGIECEITEPHTSTAISFYADSEKKANTFDAVVEFIKWYNENK